MINLNHIEARAIARLLEQLKEFLEGCIDAETVRGNPPFVKGSNGSPRVTRIIPEAPEIRKARRDVKRAQRFIDRVDRKLARG